MEIVTLAFKVMIYWLGSDNAGDRVASNSIYKRTYSAPANLHITSAGTIGRATSAKKYKISIKTNTSMKTYVLVIKNTLLSNSCTWFEI